MPTKVTGNFERYLNKIITIQQFFANLLLVFMMLIISFDVIGRNFFNKPLTGTFEMTELSSALLVFFALIVTHQNSEHVTIDFVTDKLPAKVQNIINGFIEIIITIVLLFMSRHIFANGLRMMERKATTTDLSLPLYPFMFIITLTLITFALFTIFKAIYYFRMAVDKK